MTLQNIAYTLQIGREEMEHRIAFTCSDIQELKYNLDKFQSGDFGEAFYYNASSNMKRIEEILAKKDNIKKIKKAVIEKTYILLQNCGYKDIL